MRLILEEVSRDTYGDVIRDWVIDPIKLEQTYVGTGLDTERALLPAYDRKFSEHNYDVRPQYHTDWIATGVVVSTMKDVCRFHRKLKNSEILSDLSLSQMLAANETPYWIGPRGAPFNGKLCNGLGIKVCNDFRVGELDTFYGHGGDCPGYSIWAGCVDVRGKRITICVVRNETIESTPDLPWMRLVENLLGQKVV